MDTEIIKKIKPTTWLSSLAALGVALAALLVGFAYFFPAHSLAQPIRTTLPIPVASIGWSDMITSRALAEDMASIRNFYETQNFEKMGLRVDFSTKEGAQRLKLRERDLLNKMLEDRVIRRLAAEAGIVVTPEMARQGVEKKIEELGTGSTVEQNLARLYGWTLSDFSEKVVMPSLYEEKLLEQYEKEENGKNEAKKKIEAAAAAVKAKRVFAEVAKEFSEGQTANSGGELGWFALSDLAPDLQAAVENAKRGAPTDIVESELGYHILLVTESKLEEGKRLYHLQQIFTRKPSFSDWLTENMRRLPMRVYSREYRWNAEEAAVEFRGQEMREFEQQLLEQAEGDPTVLL